MNTLSDLIHDIWYQHPRWPSTFSQCSKDGCTKSARGGHACRDCLKMELAEKVGPELAERYFRAVAEVRDCEYEMEESEGE